MLLEDGRLDILVTSSSASSALLASSASGLLAPEAQAIDVSPLDFDAFLRAKGDRATVPLLRSRLETLTALGARLGPAMKAFGEYALVGGMPQAAEAFGRRRDLREVDVVKHETLSGWREDMAAQRVANPERVLAVFEQVPAQLRKPDKRFALARVSPDARMRSFRGAAEWLGDSGLAVIARSAEVRDGTSGTSGTPRMLSAGRTFKLYVADTGLLAAEAARARPELESALRQAALSERLDACEGMLLENVVAQCLKAGGHAPRFCVERDSGARRTVMSIDFLIRRNGRVTPIMLSRGKGGEGGELGAARALARFRERFGPEAGEGVVLHRGDVRREAGVLFLPWCMAAVL